jgi:hypothetical protein
LTFRGFAGEGAERRRIEPVRNGVEAVELAPKLSDHNLISGVVDAGDWIA